MGEILVVGIMIGWMNSLLISKIVLNTEESTNIQTKGGEFITTSNKWDLSKS